VSSLRGLIRHPVAQFLAAGCLAVLLVGVATSRLSRDAADDEAIDDARALTVLLADNVVTPALPRGLVDGRPAAIDRLDRAIFDQLEVPDLRRIKIWSLDGTILYSDDPRLIGSSYELEQQEIEVIRDGGTDAEISDLSLPENRFERELGGLLEVYTGVESPEGDQLLFEAYYATTGVDSSADDLVQQFRPITLGAIAVLVAVTTPLMLLLTRRARVAAEQRERLLATAIEASDAERTRIARDLHDGVVQDLAGSSFQLSTIATRDGTDAALSEELDEVSRSLRVTMRSLRSLLVEIYPPDLAVTGLAPALDDLLSPLAAAGITTSLDVSLKKDVPSHLVELTWRVVQEAVRNAARHSAAQVVEVAVVVEGALLVAHVRDDGIGFDQDAAPDPAHFGLRGMATLVREAGGQLGVESRPGDGTTVSMELIVP
jgi:two-component system, NarL family, sensor kinase